MQDILTKPDFDLTEIINGEERMAPSPFGYHQSIVNRINYLILTYLEKNPIGEVYISPLDVILEEGINRLQPDLIFIKNENKHIFQDWIRGVPDLLIEIVSKGTHTRDTVEKKEIYERYAVSEYWLVYPETSTIEIFTLEDKRFKIFSSSDYTMDIVKSKLFVGLEIELKKIFY
ncbi:MAG: Uma2 family endonuclease [Leptospiraceae bacterium]|nr:Uma2 family endonuclease [Leptospiraceae bacterium]